MPFFCISKDVSNKQKNIFMSYTLKFFEKRNKITRSGLYQDTNKGGLHENYMGLVFKSFILRQMFVKKINSEFLFKFIHRSTVCSKKRPTQIQYWEWWMNNECLYIGQNDSINHTSSGCIFTKTFASNVLQQFNSP